MPQADRSLCDLGLIRVGPVAQVFLVGIADHHEQLIALFDDRDLVWNSRCKKTRPFKGVRIENRTVLLWSQVGPVTACTDIVIVIGGGSTALGRITDVISMHLAEVDRHRGYGPLVSPLGYVFRQAKLCATRGLDV